MTPGPVVVLAPDSFKESLSAREVCCALEEGLVRALPGAEFVHVPMADGGEGTTQALIDATGGNFRTVAAHDALGRVIESSYGVLGGRMTAVVEMARASGLENIQAHERDALRADSRGTGELIRSALDDGATHLVVAIGGSATNDAGAGAFRELGVRFLDEHGAELEPGGAALARLHHLDISGLDPRLADVTIDIACDVTNPLTGPRGASAVYGPQKGASRDDVLLLDAALARFAQVVETDLGRDIDGVPGAGAAGGLGAGFLAFTGASLRPGIDIVIEHTGLEDHVRRAQLVITGEGRMDGQTLNGKTPFGVAETAIRNGVPVVAIAGSIGAGAQALDDIFTAVLPVVPRAASLTEVLSEAYENVARTAFQAGRLMHLTLR